LEEKLNLKNNLKIGYDTKKINHHQIVTTWIFTNLWALHSNENQCNCFYVCVCLYIYIKLIALCKSNSYDLYVS
jgi:hypothetical protein